MTLFFTIELYVNRVAPDFILVGYSDGERLRSSFRSKILMIVRFTILLASTQWLASTITSANQPFGMFIMRNTLMIKAATLAATVAMTTTVSGVMSSAQAATISRTVNGVNYDITTVTGTFNSLQATLQAQPWWGSSTSAGQFATVVGNSLGLPNFFGINGPLFSYSSGRFFGINTNTSQSFVLGSVVPSARLNSLNLTYATAKATPVPTPALLPGLLGLGAIAWRKRKAAAAVEA